MRIVCSYCRVDVGDKEPLDDRRVTHGMCEPCAAAFAKQWGGIPLGEHLDAFRFPVYVVNEERRIIAANALLAEEVGMRPRALFGLLGGEAFECRYAKLEEGCGETEHCRTCAIRRSIDHTRKTGEAVRRIKAYVDRDGGRYHVYVSTAKRGAAVQVAIEPCEDEDVDVS